MKRLFILTIGLLGSTPGAYSQPIPQDSSLLVHEKLQQYWNGNEWENLIKTGYAYDGDLRKIEETDSGWTGTSFTQQNRRDYVYDSQGRLIEMVELEAALGWDTSRAFYYVYDSEGRRVKMVRKAWVGWAGAYYMDRWTTTFDSVGRVAQESTEYVVDGTWENSTLRSYEYDIQGNLKTELYRKWQSNAWVNFNLWLNSYDAGGKRIQSTQAIWDSVVWDTVNSVTYSYDSNGFVSMKHRRVKQEGIWIDSDLNTYTNDDNGNPLWNLFQYWEDTVLITSSQIQYEYNASGKLTSSNEEQWRVGEWVPSHLNEIVYDPFDNVLTNTHNNWSGTTWVYTARTVYSYQWLTTDVDPQASPLQFNLANNYPNPFNPATTIHYSIQTSSVVQMMVYNILGEIVAIPVDGFHQPGEYQLVFDGASLPGGVYYYRIRSGGLFSSTKKMVLLK